MVVASVPEVNVKRKMRQACGMLPRGNRETWGIGDRTVMAGMQMPDLPYTPTSLFGAALIEGGAKW